MKENLKQLLLTFVLFLAFSLMFIFLFINSLNYYNGSKITYDDLIYGKFTVVSIKEIKDPEMDNMYYINVAEEEKDIKVNNLLANRNVRSGILSLKNGDIIYCYLIDGSPYYEIVELKTETSTILSLDDYNEIYKRQGIIGIITSPIGCAIMLGIAIKAFVMYMKEKKETSIY